MNLRRTYGKLRKNLRETLEKFRILCKSGPSRTRFGTNYDIEALHVKYLLFKSFGYYTFDL